MISKDRLVLQKQIYNFMRSLTIKFEPIALYVNYTVSEKGYPVNDNAPETWKYYKNLQGLYHESDTEMYVTSLDTRETILFSPENLRNHPRTRSVYLPGGLYYKRLCALYPEQVDLIKSILFPIDDVEKAIAAENLTLLGYGSGFLEEYEEGPIVDELVNFLDFIRARWFFPWLDDEPYYYITFWGSLTFWIAAFISGVRESFQNTPYVHNWFIWNKLRSLGIDDYSDVLDRKKSLFLYQNIDYLVANVGKQSNLVILAKALLNDFAISLYGRKVVQEVQTGADDYQLIPQLEAVRIPIDNSLVTAEISTATVQTIQSEAYARGLTKNVTPQRIQEQERRLGDTRLNDFMTKILEIRPITKSKDYAYELEKFIVETLVVSIINGYYSEPVTVTDKATDISLYLGPRELLAIYHYAILKSVGDDPIHIPNSFLIRKAFKTEITPPAERFTYDGRLHFVSMFIDMDQYYSDLHYIEDLETPEDFSSMLDRLWLRYMDHMLLDQKTKIKRKGNILRHLYNACHESKIHEVDLIPGFTEYEAWFGPGGIDIASTVLTQYEVSADSKAAWKNLADSIMEALVPMTSTLDYFGNFTLSDYGYDRIQNLFVQMCSYRVVFLASSRDIPDSSLGTKWETDYGPEIVEVHSNSVSSVIVKEVKFMESNGSHYLQQGACLSESNNTEEAVNYSVISKVNPTNEETNTNSSTVSLTKTSFSDSTTANVWNIGFNSMNIEFSDI